MLIGSILAVYSSVAGSFPACGASEFRPAVEPIPVNIVDCDEFPAGPEATSPPLALVGSLFTGGHCFRDYNADRVSLTPEGRLVRPDPCVGNKFTRLMGDYLRGNVRPRPSGEQEETCVFLASPALSNGMDGGVGVGGFDFTIDSLTRVTQTRLGVTFMHGPLVSFQVHASVWRDDSKHEWSPGSLRKAQMLRLGDGMTGGWLAAGEYVLEMHLHELKASVDGGHAFLFREEKHRVGSVVFTVNQGDPWAVHTWDQAPSAAAVRIENMDQPEQGEDMWLQPPVFGVRRATQVREGELNKETQVVVGIAEPAVLPGAWKNHEASSAPLWNASVIDDAKHTPAGASTLVARIIGWDQSVSGADTVEVTRVEWRGDEVRVRVKLWRRTPRTWPDEVAAKQWRPEVVVPLETRALAKSLGDSVTLEAVAKRVRVVVEWE